MTATSDVLTTAAAESHEALTAFEHLLRGIADAELHLADPEGGWTVAQIVSHMHISGLLWIADLERLRHRDSMFMFREELGHDVVGAPPPSAREAADRIVSLREALDDCLPAADPAVLDKPLEVPPFGQLTAGAAMPLIIGHLTGHVEQATAILRTRGVL
jgi:uncharacterized damage-inducible protein DinB